MTANADRKPLGRKAYGSIGHLPNSRLGPTDSSVSPGQARICTVKTRDKHDTIICQEKLDGSCTAVAKVGGKIVALGRAGYLARTSPYELHHSFAKWVEQREGKFFDLLNDGERIVGEWLAVAHGTRYDLSDFEPWAAFDIMIGSARLPYKEFIQRNAGRFRTPHVLHIGGAISVADAMQLHEANKVPCDQTEGVVYRVERNCKVDFLAKYVRHDKQDGKYLSRDPLIYNWVAS